MTADTYAWANPYGGSWTTASDWSDTTIGTVATSAPGVLNSVVITGGSGSFTDIIGNGAAAQLAINNDVLLWGSIGIAGTVVLGAFADLDLDGGASLAAAGLSLADNASLQVGDAGTLNITTAATVTAAFLLARDGSIVQLGGLVANAVTDGFTLATNVIAVDASSSIEVGSAGGAALGAVTFDGGVTAAVSGSIDGNLVVNGVLGIQADGALGIDRADPFGAATAISGSGTLTLSENSILTLGVADAAAIAFGGPDGTLALDVLPSGTVSGFGAGDVIEIMSTGSSIATGLRFVQTSANAGRLSLVKGGVSVGTLALAGNYAGDLFHLGFDTSGDGFISLQTVGTAPVQPGLIAGTAGYDVLTATANNQTITGLGGNDTLSAQAVTGIDFKDTSADLNGSTITSFGTSDVIDLTDLNPSAATISLLPGLTGPATLVATSGTNIASIEVSFAAGLPVGNFTTSADGTGGTDVSYAAANTNPYTFKAARGNYAVATKWLNTATGTVAAVAPSYGNPVTLNGGLNYTQIKGTGFAANITTVGDVLIWGTVVAGSVLAGVSGALAQTGTLALDGSANLVLDGTATIGGLVQIGGNGTFTAAALSFAGPSGSLLALGGTTVRVPAPLASAGVFAPSTLGVGPASSIEFGSAGSAAAGAVTIDGGMTVDLAGSIYGNVVLNGTLVDAGTLDIAAFGSVAPSVGGTGTLQLNFGDTLGLAGPDTAAILFSQTPAGNFSSITEVLALGTIMPTGTIAGFTQGDVITTGLTVTNLTWSAGHLTLLDGSTAVGSLLLAGTYAASQFQVQPTNNGTRSAITYASAPSTVSGATVSTTTHAYTWNSTAGGVWDNASEWTDTTAGGTASAAPGANSAVTISDNSGSWTPQIIDGPAAASSLTITAQASTILTGSFAIGGLFSVSNYGTSSVETALYAGSNMTAGSLSLSSLFRVASASLLTVAGSSTGTFVSGELAVEGGSVVRVQGGTSVITGTVSVDATSSVEFGTLVTATGGNMVIDFGQDPTLQGVATIESKLTVNGGLLVYAGTIEGFGGSAGTIGGTGTITIGALGAPGSLVLNAQDTAAIAFKPYILNGAPYETESLELKASIRAGTISGFSAGDSIVIDSGVTGATFVQTTATQGTLTLTDGSSVAGTLTFAGNYAAEMFQIDVAALSGAATLTVQAATTSAGGAAANAGTDAYSWTGASGGSWTSAANWQDTTTGATPATVAGPTDPVTVSGSSVAGQYTTIGGNGAAAALTVSGNVLFTGLVNVAVALNVASAAGPAGSLAIENGASLMTARSANIFGRLETGGGSTSTISWIAQLSGGSVVALDGSTIQAGGLAGNGNGNVIAIDPSSCVRIGWASYETAGALTVCSDAYYAAFAGVIYGSVISNGNLSVSGGGTLMIDMAGTAEIDPYEINPTISGTGTLTLSEGSTLGLGVGDSAAIQFNGPNGTLDLVTIPTGTISGFTTGDQIELDRTVTGFSYTQVNATLANITLTDGTATVGVLKLAGSFTGTTEVFHLDSSANGATAVISLQAYSGAPVQPSLIYGTYGSDSLAATASGQTMIGLGGNDTLSGGGFLGIDFRDSSADLSGSQILNFSTTDAVDLTDMSSGLATVTYANGVLSATDGTHSASLTLSFGATPSSGSFHVANDGGGGSLLQWY